MSDRFPCAVAGCRRTRATKGETYCWWLCQNHWRLVPTMLKRVKARHERQCRKFGFYPDAAGYGRVCSKILRRAGA